MTALSLLFVSLGCEDATDPPGGNGGSDGTSELDPADCEDDIVDSRTDCMLDDAYCREMTDGRWCTGPDDGSSSDCEGQIVDSRAHCLVDDAFCNEMNDGRWCTGTTTPNCPVGTETQPHDETCPSDYHCWQYSEGLQCRMPCDATDQCDGVGGAGGGAGD